MDDDGLPEFYGFPPFFTLQPVLGTRHKQLELWRDLVLSWHKARGLRVVAPVADCPLWANEAIGRRLNAAGVDAVTAFMVEGGHAEWEDEGEGGRTRLRLLWEQPAAVAAALYVAVTEAQLFGSVHTVFGLVSGDAAAGLPVEGMEPWLVMKVLQRLEAEGKAQLFGAEVEDETGVKFVPV